MYDHIGIYIEADITHVVNFLYTFWASYERLFVICVIAYLEHN